MQRFFATIDKHAKALLTAMIVGYIGVFATLSCLKLAWFRQGFDMAGNEQTIWNTLHGRPFQISVFAMMRYDFDDGPVLLQLPLALLYGIHQSPYTLLILQSIALGIAAWPLYLIVRELLPKPWHALIIAAIYLLHPTTQHINMYEFQLRSFMIPFALAALLYLRRERLGLYCLFLFLMLCTKTEAGFTLIAFGLYAAWQRKPWKFIVFPLVLGPAWVGVALGVIVPAFSEGDFIANIYSYGRLGANVGDVIKTMLTNPALAFSVMTQLPKLRYLWQLFGLGGFLALFSPTLLLALPVLALNLISPNAVQFSLNYQYGSLVYPFLIVASVEGLLNLTRWTIRNQLWRERAVHGVVLGLLLISIIGNLTLNNVVKTAMGNRENATRVADAQAILAQVPDDAAVAASTFLAPHLAQRQEIYFFPGNKSYPAEYIARAEYLVVDRRPPGNSSVTRAALDQYLNDPAWVIVAEAGDFALLKQQ